MGRLSGPLLRWEKVCVAGWVGTCAERKVRQAESAWTTRIGRVQGCRAPWPLPGLGRERPFAPCHTCFTQCLVEQAFPQCGQLSRRSSCYWYPHEREEPSWVLADRVTASTAHLCVSLASALYCSKPGSFSSCEWFPGALGPEHSHLNFMRI